MGTYVAAIVMSQLAFEELFRAHYRAFAGNPAKAKKIDRMTFSHLITQANADGWLSSDEESELNRVRSQYRNPYVHTHDYSDWETSDFDTAKPNFIKINQKLYAPQLVEKDVVDESWDAIRLLVTLFSVIARRFGGIG